MRRVGGQRPSHGNDAGTVARYSNEVFNVGSIAREDRVARLGYERKGGIYGIVRVGGPAQLAGSSTDWIVQGKNLHPGQQPGQHCLASRAAPPHLGDDHRVGSYADPGVDCRP